MIEKIKKYLLAASIVAVLFFKRDLIFSEQSQQADPIRSDAQHRTVIVSWGTQTWSGLIFSEDASGMNILTIIHQDAMKKIIASGKNEVTVVTESGKTLKAEIISWDGCQEISMLKVLDKAYNERFSETKIEKSEQYLSENLFSFGHPLGLKIHYSQGVLTSKDVVIKECGMITYGFSGGTMPGQTGSGVWNDKGELSGLIVATSAYQIKTMNSNGEILGYSNMPVDFLGRYIPSSIVSHFLANQERFSIKNTITSTALN